jgi:hypothetical protein
VEVDLVGGPAIEAGVWSAQLSWTGPAGSDVLLKALDGNGSLILDGGLIGANERKAEWNGQANTRYTARAFLATGGPVSFELSIEGPCINTP